MKRFEVLRIIIYLTVGVGLVYALGSDFIWDHVPAPISENIGKVFAGLLLILMVAPVIIVLVDAVFSKKGPRFLRGP